MNAPATPPSEISSKRVSYGIEDDYDCGEEASDLGEDMTAAITGLVESYNPQPSEPRSTKTLTGSLRSARDFTTRQLTNAEMTELSRDAEKAYSPEEISARELQTMLTEEEAYSECPRTTDDEYDVDDDEFDTIDDRTIVIASESEGESEEQDDSDVEDTESAIDICVNNEPSFVSGMVSYLPSSVGLQTQKSLDANDISQKLTDVSDNLDNAADSSAPHIQSGGDDQEEDICELSQRQRSIETTQHDSPTTTRLAYDTTPQCERFKTYLPIVEKHTSAPETGKVVDGDPGTVFLAVSSHGDRRGKDTETNSASCMQSVQAEGEYLSSEIAKVYDLDHDVFSDGAYGNARDFAARISEDRKRKDTSFQARSSAPEELRDSGDQNSLSSLIVSTVIKGLDAKLVNFAKDNMNNSNNMQQAILECIAEAMPHQIQDSMASLMEFLQGELNKGLQSQTIHQLAVVSQVEQLQGECRSLSERLTQLCTMQELGSSQLQECFSTIREANQQATLFRKALQERYDLHREELSEFSICNAKRVKQLELTLMQSLELVHEQLSHMSAQNVGETIHVNSSTAVIDELGEATTMEIVSHAQAQVAGACLTDLPRKRSLEDFSDQRLPKKPKTTEMDSSVQWLSTVKAVTAGVLVGVGVTFGVLVSMGAS